MAPSSSSSSPSTLSQVRDSLDVLLQEYLACLDQYQTARALVHSHLQQGYFDLAKAKLALGPARIGPQSYDLGDKHAQRIVSIALDPSSPIDAVDQLVDDAAADSRAAQQEGSSAAPPPLPSWTVHTRVSLPAAPPTPPPDSGLRQRARRPSVSTPANPLSASPSDPPAPTPAPAPSSPLAQFSALPPPALRSAAAAFARAAEAAARVVEAERALRACARRVKRAKKEVAGEVARAGMGRGAAEEEGGVEGGAAQEGDENA